MNPTVHHGHVLAKPDASIACSYYAPQVEVCFRPQIVGPQRFFITCSTIAGRSFTLPCRASGVAPLIELSHNEITMPATAVLDTTTTSTIIRCAAAAAAAAVCSCVYCLGSQGAARL